MAGETMNNAICKECGRRSLRMNRALKTGEKEIIKVCRKANAKKAPCYTCQCILLSALHYDNS